MTRRAPPPDRIFVERWPDGDDDQIHYTQTGYGISMRSGQTSRIYEYARVPTGKPEALILRILKDLPEAKRLDVLATVCAAYCQTGGKISSDAKRSSRETVLGPLKRKAKR